MSVSHTLRSFRDTPRAPALNGSRGPRRTARHPGGLRVPRSGVLPDPDQGKACQGTLRRPSKKRGAALAANAARPQAVKENMPESEPYPAAKRRRRAKSPKAPKLDASSQGWPCAHLQKCTLKMCNNAQDRNNRWCINASAKLQSCTCFMRISKPNLEMRVKCVQLCNCTLHFVWKCA